jgi:hypothetical protein
MLHYVEFGVAVIIALALIIAGIGTCVVVVLVASSLIQSILDDTPSKFGWERLVGMVLVATVVSFAVLVIYFVGSKLWALFGPMIIH